MNHYLPYILIILVSFLGIVIQTSTGFGYGIFVMSVFPLFLNYTDALIASGFAGLFLTVVNVIRYRKEINFKKIIFPLLGFFFFTVLGTVLLQRVYFVMEEEVRAGADAVLKRILGFVLVAVALYMIFFSKNFRVKPIPVNGLAAGSIGGAMGSLFGMGGPPVVVYFLSAAESNAEYLACIQTYFLIGNVFTCVLRSASGMITKASLIYTVFALIALYPGMVLGSKVFKKLNSKSLRYMVYGFMLIMGTLFLIKVK